MAQMKKCPKWKLFSFSRSTTFMLCKFSLDQGFWSILKSLKELELIKENTFLMENSTNLGLICNKAAKVMITSIFAKRPFTKLNLILKSKLFAKRGLVISHNYTYALNLHWKILTITQEWIHKMHTLSYAPMARHLKCHSRPSFVRVGRGGPSSVRVGSELGLQYPSGPFS